MLVAGVLFAAPANAATAPVAGTQTSVATHGWSWGVSIADVTSDGRGDLIATNHEGDPGLAYSLLVYPQKPNGSLAATPSVYHLSTNPATPDNWLYTATGDLDGDGDLDVVVGRLGGLEIFRQSGGVLQSPIVLAASGPVEEIAVSDLNADGLDDLVYIDDSGGRRVVRRLQGPAGTFGAAVQIADAATGRFSIGDVNTDGRPDILTEDPWGTGLAIALHNATNQGFTASSLPISYVLSSAVADVNGDGYNDVLALQTSALWMLAGKPDGSLAPPVVAQSDVYMGASVETADVNGDGLDDVVDFSQGGVDVLLQTPGGTLTPRCPFPTMTPAPPGGYGSDSAIGDLTGDGRPDAAAVELDDFVRVTTQLAPGSPVPTSVTVDTMGPAQIHDPIMVHGMFDAGVYGCLGTPDVNVYRQLPGGTSQLFATVPLRPYGGSLWWYQVPDDPGVVGTVQYRAAWAGDAFRDATQSGTEPIDITKRATSLSLAASEPSILVGDATRLDATLLGGPDGADITFSSVEGGLRTPLATVQVDGAGHASLDVSPTTTATYEATYGGDAETDAATSPQVVVTVAKQSTSLSLRGSRALIPFRGTATLTATLQGGASDRQVQFFSVMKGHATLLGTVAPDIDGVATLEVRPTVSTDYLARYAGDATWAAAASAKVKVEVHLLASGRMTNFLHGGGGSAVYGCCRASYAFRVMPNYGGRTASIKLEANGPEGWVVVIHKNFPLRPNSTLRVVVVIQGAGGHAFRIYGCLRDQPDRRGWCARESAFRFLGRAAASTSRSEGVNGRIVEDRSPIARPRRGLP
jgi:hypothetical protein